MAAVTSNLAARERARREQASRQAWASTLLYDLSRTLASDDLESELCSVAERVAQEFGIDGVVIARSGSDGRLTRKSLDDEQRRLLNDALAVTYRDGLSVGARAQARTLLGLPPKR